MWEVYFWKDVGLLEKVVGKKLSFSAGAYELLAAYYFWV